LDRCAGEFDVAHKEVSSLLTSVRFNEYSINGNHRLKARCCRWECNSRECIRCKTMAASKCAPPRLLFSKVEINRREHNRRLRLCGKPIAHSSGAVGLSGIPANLSTLNCVRRKLRPLLLALDLERLDRAYLEIRGPFKSLRFRRCRSPQERWIKKPVQLIEAKAEPLRLGLWRFAN